MNRARRAVGADPARWAGVDADDLPAAAAIVVTTSGLLALNRFGGLVVEAPRLFTRSMLIGVWGWLGLGVTAWIMALVLAGGRRRAGSPVGMLAVAGRAHVPLLGLAIVLFVAAGLLQLRWPGLAAAFVVVGVWMPIGFVTGIATTTGLSTGRSAVVGGVPYVGWLLVIGDHLRTQLGHLV